MDKTRYVELLDTVWNISAPNVRGMRTVEGETFIGKVLWPKVQRFDAATVEAAMVNEIAEGSPPQILNVAERCVNATADWKQGPSGEVPFREEAIYANCPPAPPFDEAQRGDRDYMERRFVVAGLIVRYAGWREETIRMAAEHCGMTGEQFIAAGQDRQRRRPKRRPELLADVFSGVSK